MIWQHSCKSCLRMRWKTVLFALLIALATMFLYLAGNTWLSSERMLRECDEAYTTIAVLEYIGENYPNETEYDPAMQEAAAAFDYSVITASPYVLSWEQTNLTVGAVDSMAARSEAIPYRDSFVMIVDNIRFVEAYGEYCGNIVAALYSFTEESPGKHVFLTVPPDYNTPVIQEQTTDDGQSYQTTSFPPLYTFEQDKTYVIVGTYQNLNQPTKTLNPLAYQFNAASAQAAGVADVPPVMEITDAEQILSDPDNVYMQIADFYRTMNNKVYVQFTHDPATLAPFYQEAVKLNAGRLFTAEEAEAGAKVCVVSETVAACTGLGVGDTLQLNIIRPSSLPLSACYWTEESLAQSEEYEIVGITNYVEGYQYNVYVPQPKDTALAPGDRQYFYTLGQAVLKNGSAIAFEEALAPHLTNRMLLSTYDQGYQDVADSLSMIRTTAIVLTIAAAVSALVVLALFGFLFVGRQRETVETMLFLGTHRTTVYGYLLFGAALCTLFSAALGTFAGSLLSDQLIQSAYGAVSALQTIDLRYSNGYSGVARPFTPMSKTSPLFAFLIVLAVFAASLAFCFFFAQRIMSFHRAEKKQKKHVRAAKPPKRSSRLPGGALKFALLSIRRGGMRSLAVPLATLVLTLFLLTLAQTGSSYGTALSALESSTEIESDFTAMNGKLTGSLTAQPDLVMRLQKSGFVSDVGYAICRPLRAIYGGSSADPYEATLPLNSVQTVFLGENSAHYSVSHASIVFTNDLGTAPEFRYSTPLVEYAEGFDARMFEGEYPDVTNGLTPCLVPSEYFEELGLSFGDTVTIIAERQLDRRVLQARCAYYVAGYFMRQDTACNLYVPTPYPLETISSIRLNFANRNHEVTLDELFFAGVYVNACHFTVHARDLSTFKDLLTEQGFSGPHAESFIRVAITLYDKAFNESVRDLKQRIAYMEMLYPVLYAIIGIVGVVISYLIMSARKEEIAIMRGVGGSRFRVFRTFFLEQALLCLAGMGAGALAFRLFTGAFTFWREIALFAGCYLLGCALAISALNRTSVLQMLGERE